MLSFCANISMLFTEWPLLDRFAAARDAGFDAIEVQFPYDTPPSALARAAQAAGVSVALINAPVGPDVATLGLACVEGADALFRAELDRGLEYALALGAPCVNVLAGRTPAAERSVAVGRLIDRLSIAAELFSRKGIAVLLEPMNPVDRPDYCVTGFSAAIDILRRSDPRVRLQFDFYHAARMGVDPAATFTQLRSDVLHVQIADSPGRHEPGTGTMDWPAVFGALQAGGYAGRIGAEYIPLQGTVQGLGWYKRLRAA